MFFHLEGDGFIFWRSEQGMTFAESILSLSALLMAASVLLPFCFKLALETNERLEQQEGMRKMYEEAEARIFADAPFHYELSQRNFTGSLIWEEKNGRQTACVSSNGKKRCITEQ